MATTYGKLANKLSKKLGDYEKILEESTEPVDIESAKRSIARIQQGMELLKASQQNNPESQSVEEQEMPMYFSGGDVNWGQALGSAGSMAAAGSAFGPVGTAVGGVVGLGTSLLGQSNQFKAQEEAEAAAEEEAAQLEKDRNEYMALNQFVNTNPTANQGIDYGGSWAGMETPMFSQTQGTPNYGTPFYQQGGELSMSFEDAGYDLKSLDNEILIETIKGLEDIGIASDSSRIKELKDELWSRRGSKKDPFKKKTSTAKHTSPTITIPSNTTFREISRIITDPKTGKKTTVLPNKGGTNKIEGLGAASDEELQQSLLDAQDIGAEDAIAQIQAEIDSRVSTAGTTPGTGAGIGGTGTASTTANNIYMNTPIPELLDIKDVPMVAFNEEEYTTNTSPPPPPVTPEERDRQRNPALTALGLAPTVGNLVMGQMPRDYYPGFTNPYADQFARDLGDMRGLLGEAEEGLDTPRFYNPRPELVAAKSRRDAGMENAASASGGAARFALQNRANAQLAKETDQILTKAQNINAQWNDPRQKAQALAGLAGAYGQIGQLGYGAGRDVMSERAKKWDIDKRTDATARAFTGAGLSQLGQWAQLQQQMENQYDIDSERSNLLKDMFDYGYTPEGWKYNPRTKG